MPRTIEGEKERGRLWVGQALELTCTPLSTMEVDQVAPSGTPNNAPATHSSGITDESESKAGLLLTDPEIPSAPTARARR